MNESDTTFVNDLLLQLYCIYVVFQTRSTLVIRKIRLCSGYI